MRMREKRREEGEGRTGKTVGEMIDYRETERERERVRKKRREIPKILHCWT